MITLSLLLLLLHPVCLFPASFLLVLATLPAGTRHFVDRSEFFPTAPKITLGDPPSCTAAEQGGGCRDGEEPAPDIDGVLGCS